MGKKMKKKVNGPVKNRVCAMLYTAKMKRDIE